MKSLGYKDEVEKENLKEQEAVKGQVLLAECIHTDGNFLIFGEPKPLSLEERITALEVAVAALEKKP